MMPNQQGSSQGSQSAQAQLKAVQHPQQLTPQQQHQIQQQQQQQQQQLVQQQQQHSVSSSSQQQPQPNHQQSPAIYLPQSVGSLIPQQIMIQPNAQTFAMANGGNVIPMASFSKKPMILPNDSKSPRGKVVITSASPQLQPINSFVTGQSPQGLGNQYYTFQAFPSPNGPVQHVNSTTLLSPNNHQYIIPKPSDFQVITLAPNAFQNQLLMNGVPISVGNNAAPVISIASNHARTATKTTSSGPNTGQPCLIAPATPIATSNPLTQRLKNIKPATDSAKSSIGTQTATGSGQITIPGATGTPITIPIHLQHQQIHQQQHIQLQLTPQPQSHPSKKTKSIQSTNITNKDRSSNLDTATTVTLVPQRNAINNAASTNPVTNKPAKSKLIAPNAPLKEKVIQSPKKKTTTSGTDTGDLADHCPETNNLTNGVSKSNGSKSPQRAIVKPYVSDPNVLTHVIDGFVIQESPSPFTVNIDGLDVVSDETIIDPIDERENNEDSVMLDVDTNNMSTETPTIKAKSAKGEASCETCKKSINKFTKKKKLKRFCNTICAKKSTNSDAFKSGGELNVEMIDQNKQTSHSPAKKMKSDVPTNKVTESTEPLDSSIDGGYIPAGGSNPNLWNVQDVYDFVRHLPGCQEYADEFKSQEIDGQALMLLKEDHLMSAMNMKLGPALKICSRITSLFRAEANSSLQ